MKVEWTSNAISQLKRIHDYIAKDSEFFAKRMVDRLTSRSIQIQAHPLSGQIVPEFGNESIREVIEGPFRVVYQSSANTVYVLAVIHGARMLTAESLTEQG
jgi:toxin ParE1/3/4